ncbi:MAG: retropepsin-like aspartic protease [Chloroflexota bacterium]
MRRRPAYDAQRFNPPAPVASVTLRQLVTGAAFFIVPMLIDSGADVTLISRDVAVELGADPLDGTLYELEGFDGHVQMAEVVLLELVFLGKRFKGQFLLVDQPFGVLDGIL